jgi:hypothetical protein
MNQNQKRKRAQKQEPKPKDDLVEQSVVSEKIIDNYWPEKVEIAIKDFLSIDHTHLSYLLDTYVKDKIKKGVLDDTIDDGYENELKEKMSVSLFTTSITKKERIYNMSIKAPMKRLIEAIMFKYKLVRDDIDVKTQIEDCASHIHDKFHRFNPSQGTKAYSYFGTIAKHYLQNKKKEAYTHKKSNLNYDDYTDVIDISNNYEIDDTPVETNIVDLFQYMISMFEKNANNKLFNDNDRKLLNVIIELFKDHDEAFNGKKYEKGEIFSVILERTKMTKEEMAKSVSKLKNVYKEKKRQYINKERD